MAKAGFDITINRDFIHVELEPQFMMTLASLSAVWLEVLPLCAEHEIHRVLVTGDRPRRSMKILDSFDHGMILANANLSDLRIGMVRGEYKGDHHTDLFTFVANSNGEKDVVRLFDDRDEAVGWLRTR